MIILYILIGLVFIFLVWMVIAYNRFVTLRQRINEAWADIDVQLKRRYDLIPNLVDTVKGYMEHEQGTFEKVTEARTKAMNAGSLKDQEQAENMLTDTLKSLFAVAENYPELKANENFMELQRELSDTENKIQAARRFYNTNVRDYNTYRETVPSNMIAGMFNFTERPYFEVETEEERENVDVDF